MMMMMITIIENSRLPLHASRIYVHVTILDSVFFFLI